MVDFNVNFGKSEITKSSDLGKNVHSSKIDTLKNEPIFNVAKNSLPKVDKLQNFSTTSKANFVKNSNSAEQGKNIVISSPYDEIEQPYEEFSTDIRLDETNDNTVSKWMELTGINTKDEAVKDMQQSKKATAAENEKKNEIMNNTRASNGMTYKDAIQTYMRLYNEYLRYCQVEVPAVMQTEQAKKGGIPNGEFVGGMRFDVDPSKIEEHMSAEDKKQYHEAQQALAELEKNEEFMNIAQDSKSHNIYERFKVYQQHDGSALKLWQDYAAKNGINPEGAMNRNIKNPFDDRWG